ncbi:MAG: efflux RND transporter periplasmic adaptor subunit [Streptococcus sp.]
MKKFKKWQIITATGAAIAVVGMGSWLAFGKSGSGPEEMVDMTPMVQTVKEGSIASSVLLTGKVTANQEQYIYFDGTKGDLQSILVNVGDQVTAGQAIVQYSSTEAQSAYDAAVRAVNKADRPLNDPMTNGVTIDTTGDEEADGTGPLKPNALWTHKWVTARCLADAVANMEKAKALLDATTVKSSTDGTVVEVNKDVSKSTTGTNQTLVHIVSNGNLQVKGELSEYNLANISVGQEVTLTSKVYPGKKWTGKISYVANYPQSWSGWCRLQVLDQAQELSIRLR